VTWRGIDPDVLAEAGVSMNADGVAEIPYRDRDGSVLRMRYRSDARSWWGRGEEIVLFGLETLPRPGDPYSGFCALILTEGESDALAAREHLRGHEDDVAVRYLVLGCPGARMFRPEWRAVCEPFDVVYVVGDGDDAGHAFVSDVRSEVVWARPVVCPEGRDLRDLLQREGVGALVPLLRGADETARLQDALFHAPDLATAETWLEGGAMRTDEEIKQASVVRDDGVGLVDDIVAFVRRFVVLGDDEVLFFALFLIHTHAVKAADFTPYVVVTSPVKGCGKTTLGLKIAKLLAHNPKASSNASGAALFRSLEGEETFLLDETDGIWKGNGERAEDIRTILNAGFSRGEGKVIRCVGTGASQTVSEFPVFGPKVIIGIGRLVPPTVLDRGLGIRLQKLKRGTRVEKLRERKPPHDAALLRDRIAAWAAEHLDTLKEAEPELPDDLDARGQDICEPLVAIADLLGCSQEAQGAFVRLRAGESADTEVASELLRDTRTVLVGKQIASTDLLTALVGIEGSKWSAWWGDERDRRKGLMRLSALLGEFDITPKKLWFPDEGKSLQGYTRDSFLDAWDRYLPPFESVEVGRSEAPRNDAASTDNGGRKEAAVLPTPPAAQIGMGSEIFRSSDLLDAAGSPGGRKDPVPPRTCPCGVPGHSDVWLARDHRWRCSICDPGTFAGEVVATANVTTIDTHVPASGGAASGWGTEDPPS
jgi:Protein of unknown function (DUF3631)